MYQSTGTLSGPSQASKINLFVKIVGIFKVRVSSKFDGGLSRYMGAA